MHLFQGVQGEQIDEEEAPLTQDGTKTTDAEVDNINNAPIGWPLVAAVVKAC